MATAKLVLDARNKDTKLINLEKGTDENKYPLKMRICHGDLYRDIHLGLYVKKNQWRDNGVTGIDQSARTNAIIRRRLSIAATTLADYDHIIAKLDVDSVRDLVITAIEKQISPEIDEQAKEIIEAAHGKKESEIYLERFGEVLINRAEDKKLFKRAAWYKDGIKAIKNYAGRDIRLVEITISFLQDYEASEVKRGINKNTISYYLKAVRRITNCAVQEKLNRKRFEGYPWGDGGYTLPFEESKRRAEDKNLITEIRKLKIKKGEPLWNEKNYLLFIFNNQGMNFIDLAKLKKDKLVNTVYDGNKLVSGRLVYRRSKTRFAKRVKIISIGLTKESLSILNAYEIASKAPDDFVFPIGFEETRIGYARYKGKLAEINAGFKAIAAEAGQEVRLTTYVLRHTWATVGKKAGLNVPQIGDALGHLDYGITQVYMDKFEDEQMDSANRKVVS